MKTPVAFVALHHVRLPVSDVMRSQDWYTEVFGFETRLCLEDEGQVVGVVISHRSGLNLGLHHDPDLARTLRGFCCLALSVGSHDDLTRSCARLDALGIDHTAPTEGHLGWYIEAADPDGIVIQLHTADQPSADGA
jgi:catechol 2,3-dioxygenase-like lactoylglutathione lyase family enzyme